MICLEVEESAAIFLLSTAPFNYFYYQMSSIWLLKNKMFVWMCIHIFFEVEDLIEKNIHTEVQNKEALAYVEMAAVTGGNQSMDFQP